jgi:fatty-acyl-CoA synthase
MGHPHIVEAAVIGVSHPRWIERPIAVIVAGETSPSLDDVRAYLAPHFANWWLPDALEIVDELPRTSTGKFKKSVLRDRYAGYKLPESD